ncbi:hypothetical protein WMY93_025844 [Mugilogobius chulae]|uniref:Uncharacterized protein n=1 Tax=Mugilogobius chulae TaxID=88201 RepID=A0AAW0N0C0_9GOBI
MSSLCTRKLAGCPVHALEVKECPVHVHKCERWEVRRSDAEQRERERGCKQSPPLPANKQPGSKARHRVQSPTVTSTDAPACPCHLASLSTPPSPLEEATLISLALMRQNGSDLVCRCAAGGWGERGGRGERERGWCVPSVRLARCSPERRQGAGQGHRRAGTWRGKRRSLLHSDAQRG